MIFSTNLYKSLELGSKCEIIEIKLYLVNDNWDSKKIFSKKCKELKQVVNGIFLFFYGIVGKCMYN